VTLLIWTRPPKAHYIKSEPNGIIGKFAAYDHYVPAAFIARAELLWFSAWGLGVGDDVRTQVLIRVNVEMDASDGIVAIIEITAIDEVGEILHNSGDGYNRGFRAWLNRGRNNRNDCNNGGWNFPF
jgi:hypothetical protein